MLVTNLRPIGIGRKYAAVEDLTDHAVALRRTAKEGYSPSTGCMYSLPEFGLKHELDQLYLNGTSVDIIPFSAFLDGFIPERTRNTISIYAHPRGPVFFLDDDTLCTIEETDAYSEDDEHWLVKWFRGQDGVFREIPSRCELLESMLQYSIVHWSIESRVDGVAEVDLWLRGTGYNYRHPAYKATVKVTQHQVECSCIALSTLPELSDVNSRASRNTQSSLQHLPCWVLEVVGPVRFVPKVAISRSGKGMFVFGNRIYEFTSTKSLHSLEKIAAVATWKQLSEKNQKKINCYEPYSFTTMMNVCFG